MGWLNEEDARRMVGGEVGDIYRSVLKGACAPFGWFPKTDLPDLSNMKSGTATLVRTPDRLLGITAAHVLREWEEDQSGPSQMTLLMDQELSEIDIIDISDELDLATFNLEEKTIDKLGKAVAPISKWPPQVPMEGRGVLLGGYPRISRQAKTSGRHTIELDWGLFVGLVTAGRVSLDQISWTVDRRHLVPHAEIPDLPENAELGGISGGPVIAILERGGIHYWALAGIVSEASAELEHVIAKRADYIGSDGKISSPII